VNQVPAINQLSLLDGQGREQLRLSRTAIAVGSGADLSRAAATDRDRRPRRQLHAGLFQRLASLHVDRGIAYRRR